MNYQKTWEVMNNLEESFNRIKALEDMIEDLVEAVNNDDKEHIIDVSHALNAYMPVYTRQYEKASQRAWNNTVGEVLKIDNPYRKDTNDTEVERSLDYDEIIKYINDDSVLNL